MAGPEPLTEPPSIGEMVFVTTFGADGIVRTVAGNKAEVEIRGKKMRVAVGDLRRASAGRGRNSSPQPLAPSRAPVARQASAELMLVGSRVEEALDRAAKFLDDALLTDERRLRVVHGHGTGRLRDALRTYFREHPLVARVSPAPDDEGGGRATIVELKD